MHVETVEDSKFRRIDIYFIYTPGVSGNFLNEDIPPTIKMRDARLNLADGKTRSVFRFLTHEGKMSLLGAALLQYENKN